MAQAPPLTGIKVLEFAGLAPGTIYQTALSMYTVNIQHTYLSD